MRVIICGAGRVGQGIARQLSGEGHDITMVDEDSDLIDRVQTDYNVKGVVGHAAYPDTLRLAGAEMTDMLIAVTHFDEINMVICQIAESVFSVPSKIARIRAQAYLAQDKAQLFSRSGFGIDMVISPEIEVGEAILNRFRSPDATSSLSFEDGRLQLLGMRVSAESPLIDTALDQLDELFPDLSARVVGIKRGDVVFAPRGNDLLLCDDTAYVAVIPSHTARLNKLFNKTASEFRRFVIVGGGNVGIYVASQLEADKSVRVRLIESDPVQADIAVSKLKQTIVINGDGLSRDILEEAGANSADIVIAVTNDDKTNMLIGKLAKQMGAQKSHVLINSYELAAISSDLDIDAVLDPRALSVSRILTKLRKGRIVSVQLLEDGAGELAEGITLPSSTLIGKTVGYDDLPEGITAAAIIRKDDIIFPNKDLTIQADDRLVLFYETEMTKQVERYFRASADFF